MGHNGSSGRAALDQKRELQPSEKVQLFLEKGVIEICKQGTDEKQNL